MKKVIPLVILICIMFYTGCEDHIHFPKAKQYPADVAIAGTLHAIQYFHAVASTLYDQQGDTAAEQRAQHDVGWKMHAQYHPRRTYHHRPRV